MTAGKEHLTLKLFTAACLALALATTANAASSRHESAAEAANVAKVEAFYDKALNQKDFDAARPYLGATYVQHNPTAQDGVDGFRAFLQFLRDKFPNAHSEIKAAFADGDFVILHVLAVRSPGQPGTAIVDIFRLDHGKIAEHWDVRQDVPDKAANDNGMF